MIYFRLILESFRFAWHALRSNLLRTILSLLGVTIGIFAIISVFTIVDSLERNIRNSMSFMGSNLIYVQKSPWIFTSDYEWWRYFKRPISNLREFRKLQERLELDEGTAIYWLRSGTTIRYRNNSMSNLNIMGISYEYNKVIEIAINQGRYFTQQDIHAARNLIIIGHAIAQDLFPNLDPLGKTIKIKGLKFSVIGITEKQGEGFLGMPTEDNNIYMPYGAFNKLFSTSERGLEPIIAIKGKETDENLQELEYEVRGAMRSIRGLKPRDEDNFALNRPEMAAAFVSKMFRVIGMAGWIIGGFSILVGGFGIANIMFVSVKERTNIIGIQKSLGAKNYFILFQFLFESVFLSLIGGGIGILLVFLLTLIPQDYLELLLSLGNISLGLGVSIVIGVISGIVPALLAANLDPVMAIRSK